MYDLQEKPEGLVGGFSDKFWGKQSPDCFGFERVENVLFLTMLLRDQKWLKGAQKWVVCHYEYFMVCCQLFVIIRIAHFRGCHHLYYNCHQSVHFHPDFHYHPWWRHSRWPWGWSQGHFIQWPVIRWTCGSGGRGSVRWAASLVIASPDGGCLLPTLED